MHADLLLLLVYRSTSIKESYWPIGGQNLARFCYHKCVPCHCFIYKFVTSLMGNSPQLHLVPGGHPFETVGVYYSAPIMCASRQGRGCRLEKVYIAIFI